MKYTVPDYYNQFQCIAGACPATCCAGWQIVIDDKSLKKYRKCKTILGNRLKNSIDWKNSTFLQYDHKCSFLNEDKLCDLYTEGGPDMLCRTCRRYPRHIEEFENEREISLSLSCPVVARLVLGRMKKVTFLSKQDSREEKQDKDFDFFLYSILQDARSRMIDILQKRELSIGFRMAKVLGLAHDIQNRIDARCLFETENLLERYLRTDADDKLKKKLIQYADVQLAANVKRALLDLLDELEVLDSGWTDQLKGWKESLDRTSCDTADEIECEQLMVYFLYTYLCGAVYDGDILSKVKMSVVSTMIIQELEEAFLMRKGEPLILEDRARIAWSYSRELEHSDLNLNRMEEMMKEREAASFENLLTVCCSMLW